MGRFAKALAEVRLMKAGKLDCSRTRLTIAPVEELKADDVKAIRKAANMTQEAFAACIGVAKKTVEAWEGGRSNPDGAARRLLGLVMNNPFFFEECGVYERIRVKPAKTLDGIVRHA